jgi:hypothetical protein
MLDGHLIKPDFQFLRHQRRERCHDALAHFGARGDDGDLVVRPDFHIGIERRFALAARPSFSGFFTGFLNW